MSMLRASAISISMLALGLMAQVIRASSAMNGSLQPEPPDCAYTDPPVYEAPVNGGLIYYSCRNLPSPPPQDTQYFDDCYYWICDSNSGTCSPSMPWVKWSRHRELWATPGTFDPTSYTTPMGSIHVTPDMYIGCCHCTMPPPPPSWIPN